MAAPAVNANNYSRAVDKLAMMFPTIERPTIENILVNECNGDSTKSIVILTKIQQFNRSMNNPNVNNTSTAGETVQPTAAVPLQRPASIPLQVVVPQPTNYNNQGDCCSSDSCACCLMKPASYKNGLYPIDYTMYNVSFFILAVATIYPDCTLDALSISYHGLYLPLVGLICMGIAAIFQGVISSDEDAVGRGNKYGTMRGCLYIFGGLFYFLGYMVHAGTVPEHDLLYDFFDSIYQSAPYLVGRGIFVGIHAMFVGYLYVTNNRLPRWLGARLPLIRFWTVLFIVYHVLVLGFSAPLYIIVWAALVVLITLFLNFCLLHTSNESGGCNSGASLGLIIVIAYYFHVSIAVMVVIARRVGYFYSTDQAWWYVLWEIAMLIFGSMQLWIMTRAMHPVNANCGCTLHGLGDGNVASGMRTEPHHQSVVMVVQPQQTR